MDMIDINVKALTYFTGIFVDRMRKRGGVIVNIASTASFWQGGPLMAAYYGSKSYVLALDEGIRGELEVSKSPLRLVTLCPGPTSSGFVGMRGKKEWYISSPKEVALACLVGIEKKKEIIIPGFLNKVFYYLSKIIPRRYQRRLIYKIQNKK